MTTPNIEARLNTLETEFRAFVHENSRQHDDLYQRVDSLGEDIRYRDHLIMEELKDIRSSLSERIDDVKNSLSERIDDVKNSLSERIDQLGGDLHDLNQKIDLLIADKL